MIIKSQNISVCNINSYYFKKYTRNEVVHKLNYKNISSE